MPRGLVITTLLVFTAALFAAAMSQLESHRDSGIGGRESGQFPASPIPNLQSPPAPPPPDSRIPIPESPSIPLLGFTLNLHHNNEHELYQQAVTDLADMGFDTVQFTVPVFQTDGRSDEIRIETGPGRGPRADRLIDLIRRARARRMTVILSPILLFTKPRGDEWRGKISPHDWNNWWTSYRRMTEHFLQIAAEHDVRIYVVGSELLSTENQPHRWQAIIAAARSRFRGQLTYASHWDRYDAPAFWKQLDLVSVNEYFDVTQGRGLHRGATDGAEASLAAAWGRRRDTLLAFAARVGKPLLFTELGYPSLPWALERPWKYTHTGVPADHDAQAAGYRAFLSAWRPQLVARPGGNDGADPGPSPALTGTAPFAGVVFYEWDPYRRGEPTDTHYGIRGKPAESMLRELLNGRK